MTIRIQHSTKIALDLYAAKQTLKKGRNFSNDETIIMMLEEIDPDLLTQAERLAKERAANKQSEQ